MRKVKSGPSGIWGIDNGNRLYTIVGKRWIQMAEISRDVEPSLPDHVYRISTYSKTSCLVPNQIEPFSPNFQNNYYYRADISCADSSNCLSLGPKYDLFKITKTACPFTDSRIDYQSSLTDIEVTSGGGVFGLNSSGFLSYRANLNRGGSWTLVENSVTFKSVSYSFEHAIIWLVDSNDNALACSWLNGSL
uniref:Uncharacterized protein n=1 Tax=Eptatretus burgeri TaxID=7764 RepID=A0A8C4R0S4_EPTBU